MIGRYFILFSLLLTLFLVSPSYASECRKPSPAARFSSDMKQIEYIRTDSVNDLTDWQMGHNIMAKKVLGVGGGSIGVKLKAKYTMTPAGNDEVCIIPVEMQAVFYASPQIHIASNFARGSCEYSEVLYHEQKHITELRKFFREYKEPYNRYFQSTIDSLPAPDSVALDQAEATKKETTAYVMDQLNAYNKEIMADLNERQSRIDTQEEYERVISKCKNWDKKISESGRSY